MSGGVYVYLEQRSRRCFLEQLPGETIIKGEYKFLDYKEGGVMNQVNVKIFSPGKNDNNVDFLYDPEVDGRGNEILFDHALSLKEPAGRFAYHAMNSGFHHICFYTGEFKNEDSKELKFEVKLEIQEKNSEISNEIARKNHLTKFDREVQGLGSSIDLLLKELEYAETQEKHFTSQSERINSRIVMFSVIQVAFLLFIGFWQIIHLRAFFRAKKLV